MESKTLTEKSYDEVLYISKPFSLTQPIRMKSVMQLFGFETPKIENARVLEIGCSMGGNLIPTSIYGKNTEVIGIDLSTVQIQKGKEILNYIGSNIKLYSMNILDYNLEFGKFDYIICHGVFSWVNKTVQDKILEVIKESLNPKGVACISYNTYPGWKNLDILREIMIFRKQLLEKRNIIVESEKMVDYGKSAITFLKDHSKLGPQLKNIIDDILTKEPNYVYHEFFELDNKPLYLYEFNDMLEKYGLSHVIDSQLSVSLPIHKNTEVEMDQILTNECGDDRICIEQYYDYLNNTQFRISLVTHKDNDIKISKTFNIKNLENIYLRGIFTKTENGYITHKNINLSMEYGVLVEYLNEKFPEYVSYSEIVETLKGKDNNGDTGRYLLDLIYYDAVEYTAEPIKIIKQEKIKINNMIRKHVEYVLETNNNPLIMLSNPNGYMLSLEDVELKTLLMFDGEKTDQDVIEEIFVQQEVQNDETRALVEDLVSKIRRFVETNTLNI